MNTMNREDKYALNESMVSEATPWDTVADLASKEKHFDLSLIHI